MCRYVCNNDTSDRKYKDEELQSSGMLVKIHVLVFRIRTPMRKISEISY
jgi:hypothetical protein